ncbi:MAG TPA: VOC family protein [Myxococcota bacterium]|nr:VOC family protein [Myxococcota bacterium]
MKFTGLHFFVRDMGRTIAFYRRLGLRFPDGAENNPFASTETEDGVHLAFGTYALSRGYDRGFKEPSGASPNCLQFAVASREETDRIYHELTAAGHEGHLPPHDAFWGSRYAEVIDPDGNLVGFQSPTDPARRSPPPA